MLTACKTEFVMHLNPLFITSLDLKMKMKINGNKGYLTWNHEYDGYGPDK